MNEEIWKVKKEAKGESVGLRYFVSFVPEEDKQKMEAGTKTSGRSKVERWQREASVLAWKAKGNLQEIICE